MRLWYKPMPVPGLGLVQIQIDVKELGEVIDQLRAMREYPEARDEENGQNKSCAGRG